MTNLPPPIGKVFGPEPPPVFGPEPPPWLVREDVPSHPHVYVAGECIITECANREPAWLIEGLSQMKLDEMRSGVLKKKNSLWNRTPLPVKILILMSFGFSPFALAPYLSQIGAG